ncbi:MAG: Ig-like domain-containing protein [Candidatus Eisenbacteria bacterium]|uniref:Ig-like domain-containing protein n=1 Tax=Eiseniibacteriota bacterium TaxID=2212470 RepID=A0A933W9V3_UNCEI|nr:Ig-like domain-containing protein [Candidatus Eisenbacteria bacterium]
MKLLRSWALASALALAASAAGAGLAGAVALSFGTGSGAAGQTVDIDVNTASMTGLGVMSAQMSVSYNNTLVTAVDVLTTGTLTGAAGWNTPAFAVTNVGGTGKITFSSAGTTALSGAGALFKVRFVVNPAQLGASASSLTLSNVVFNEGSPTATVSSGTLTILATPQIDVSPDAGEVVRGQTLQFSVSGSVTNPMTWQTSNPAVATISSTGLLTGVAPGTVTVTGTDAALHSSTTTGVIAVRGMGLTAGVGVTPLGQTVSVPITVTSLAGLGIRAGQFTLTWSNNMVASYGVSTPLGTLLNGWGTVSIGGTSNRCTVDFAGGTDLSGSGVLCYVTFTASPVVSSSSTLILSNALFNETLPAKTTNGSITVSALPAITVSPEQVTLLAGQSQQMTVFGSPTLPLTWTVLDPTVATISPTGLLSAVHSGVTQVRATDAIGSTDLNTSVRVYDFKATLGTVMCRPGSTVRVPLLSDRGVGALGVVSEQFKVSWSGTGITGARTTNSSLWSLWGPDPGVRVTTANSITIAAAGPTPFDDSALELCMLEFDISPAAATGTNIPLTVSQLIFNEGDPDAQVVNGTIQVRNLADVESGEALAFALGESAPNPVRTGCRIPFALPSRARVQLAIYGVDGRCVRTLVDGTMEPGRHDVTWDGRDDRGAGVDAGIYFVRLAAGERSLSRKLVVISSRRS